MEFVRRVPQKHFKRINSNAAETKNILKFVHISFVRGNLYCLTSNIGKIIPEVT